MQTAETPLRLLSSFLVMIKECQVIAPFSPFASQHSFQGSEAAVKEPPASQACTSKTPRQVSLAGDSSALSSVSKAPHLSGARKQRHCPAPKGSRNVLSKYGSSTDDGSSADPRIRLARNVVAPQRWSGIGGWERSRYVKEAGEMEPHLARRSSAQQQALQELDGQPSVRRASLLPDSCAGSHERVGLKKRIRSKSVSRNRAARIGSRIRSRIGRIGRRGRPLDKGPCAPVAISSRCSRSLLRQVGWQRTADDQLLGRAPSRLRARTDQQRTPCVQGRWELITARELPANTQQK